MNQVVEILRMRDATQALAGVARLESLLDLMERQPGFLRAEVLHSVDAPELLLALHAWRELSDWQTFQTSAAKITFSASRPAALYDFVPCGMNWELVGPDQDMAGSVLRREVILSDRQPEARAGRGVAASSTFRYQDDLTEFRGGYLRLTRYQGETAIEDAHADRASGVHADEVYESQACRNAVSQVASTGAASS